MAGNSSFCRWVQDPAGTGVRRQDLGASFSGSAEFLGNAVPSGADRERPLPMLPFCCIPFNFNWCLSVVGETVSAALTAGQWVGGHFEDAFKESLALAVNGMGDKLLRPQDIIVEDILLEASSSTRGTLVVLFTINAGGGCHWVLGGNDLGETQTDDADSPAACADLVRSRCPGATIANYAIDGGTECYCETGDSIEEDPDDGWMSCMLPNSPGELQVPVLPSVPARLCSPLLQPACPCFLHVESAAAAAAANTVVIRCCRPGTLLSDPSRWGTWTAYCSRPSRLLRSSAGVRTSRRSTTTWLQTRTTAAGVALIREPQQPQPQQQQQLFSR